MTVHQLVTGYDDTKMLHLTLSTNLWVKDGSWWTRESRWTYCTIDSRRAWITRPPIDTSLTNGSCFTLSKERKNEPWNKTCNMEVQKVYKHSTTTLKPRGTSHPLPAQALPGYQKCKKQSPPRCLALRTRDAWFVKKLFCPRGTLPYPPQWLIVISIKHVQDKHIILIQQLVLAGSTRLMLKSLAFTQNNTGLNTNKGKL